MTIKANTSENKSPNFSKIYCEADIYSIKEGVYRSANSVRFKRIAPYET